jgi:hypothetical protein
MDMDIINYVGGDLPVTDGVEEVCVDPGEMGAILEAGGVGGPGPPGEGKGWTVGFER